MEEAEKLLALYDRALPQVYGYLVDRCGDVATAEDLTSETFLAAVAAAKRSGDGDVSIPWLMGVARHKLVDHWRRRSRDERLLLAVADNTEPEDLEPFDAHLDRLRANDVLARLGPHHRARVDVAVRRWPAGARGCRAARAHGARDRGAPRSRTCCLPEDLRERRARCLTFAIPSTTCGVRRCRWFPALSSSRRCSTGCERSSE